MTCYFPYNALGTFTENGVTIRLAVGKTRSNISPKAVGEKVH